MDRANYRLALVTACMLAAWVGPVIFLAERLRTDYLFGGLAAALLTWAFLWICTSAEPKLSAWMLAVMGAGGAVLSWVTISLVTLFEVVPQVLERGLERFDPVWFMGGLAPLIIPAVALWQVWRGAALWHSLATALYRFSVPLFGLQVTVQVLGLPKQFRWLFLFTGVMFLVLDGLGTEAKEPRSAP